MRSRNRSVPLGRSNGNVGRLMRGQADACRVPLEDDRLFRKKSRGDRENVPIPERARSVSAALSGLIK